MTSTVTLKDLLAGIIEVPASIDKAVSDVCLDSRYCSADSVFLACDGIASHGLEYLDQAIRLGARTVLWEPAAGLSDLPDFEGIDALEVPRLSQHVGRIAARFHGDPTSGMEVVGVTGTNGKTSVAHLTAQAAEGLGKPAALFGTLGYGMLGSLAEASHTTPDAVRLQQSLATVRDAGAGLVAMEVSSHALDQHRADGVHFHTAVFTNLTHEHLDYHGDLGRYAEAKRRLFEWPGLKAAVINVDDQTGRDFLRSLAGDVSSYAFAIDAETLESVDADHFLHAADIRYSAEGLGFDLVLDGETCCTVHCDLLGRFNVSNLLAT
ncbi:MAG: Mur ligase family protein, partial [Gammaproteobacteria bacterium]|nr:Mur ligase family protein [Gammaproteobacteria bacterium]